MTWRYKDPGTLLQFIGSEADGWLMPAGTGDNQPADRWAFDRALLERAMRAVNAHDALVRACELALFAVTTDADANDGRVDRAGVAATLRDALALAEGRYGK